MKRLVGFSDGSASPSSWQPSSCASRTPSWPQWSQRTALAGLVVTVLYSLSQWRDIARSFGGRNVKYGSIAATGVVLVLGILVGPTGSPRVRTSGGI